MKHQFHYHHLSVKINLSFPKNLLWSCLLLARKQVQDYLQKLNYEGIMFTQYWVYWVLNRPQKKWLKLSTQDWVLNKSKFWVEIECSISAFFHTIIEYSISPKSEFGLSTQYLNFFTTYWVWNLLWTPNYWHL